MCHCNCEHENRNGDCMLPLGKVLPCDVDNKDREEPIEPKEFEND